jgi:hypothetical protein
MKEITTTPVAPVTDMEYTREAERLLDAAKNNLRAAQESRQRTEQIHGETQAALEDVFKTLERMAARRAA